MRAYNNIELNPENSDQNRFEEIIGGRERTAKTYYRVKQDDSQRVAYKHLTNIIQNVTGGSESNN